VQLGRAGWLRPLSNGAIMSKIFRCLVLASAVALVTPLAHAHGYQIGALKIGHPWSRATPKGATTAAGYLTVTNSGSEPDRLVGAASPAADRVEIHEMTMSNGVMTMRPVKDGLEIKPGQTVALKPGSFHLMMTRLKQPFTEGQMQKGTLTFEKAGTVEVEYKVEPIGGGAKASDDHSGAMDHSDHSGMDHSGMGH
jgi:copper(I)-binding protein